MTGKRGMAALALAMMAGGMGSAAGGATVEKTYQLQLTGDQGAHFTGSCALATADGETIIPLDGGVPFATELVGNGLACKLETEGRIVVDIEHNGSRSRSATNGGVVNISLR